MNISALVHYFVGMMTVTKNNEDAEDEDDDCGSIVYNLQSQCLDAVVHDACLLS